MFLCCSEIQRICTVQCVQNIVVSILHYYLMASVHANKSFLFYVYVLNKLLLIYISQFLNKFVLLFKCWQLIYPTNSKVLFYFFKLVIFKFHACKLFACPREARYLLVGIIKCALCKWSCFTLVENIVLVVWGVKKIWYFAAKNVGSWLYRYRWQSLLDLWT